ncbi:MAG: transcription-repair coupling factor [Thermodesulfovibrionaceae bacterium]
MKLSISEALQQEAQKLYSLLKNNKEINNLSITSFSLGLSLFQESFLVFEEDEDSAYKLYLGIKNFSEFLNIKNDVIFLPKDNTDRLKSIFRVFHENPKKVITTKEASKIAKNVYNLAIFIKVEETIERDILYERLIQAEYRKVEMVTQEGEFSYHGWVFDIWPIGEDYPIRVEFFGDEIEAIKLFYPDTQRSFKERRETWIIPAQETEDKVDLMKLFNFNKIFFVGTTLEYEYPSSVKVSHLPLKFSPEAVDAEDKSMAGVGVLPKERNTLHDFPKNLRSLNIPIVFTLSTSGKAKTIKEILFNHDIIAPIINKNEVGLYSGRYAITVADIYDGFFRENLMLITESELFTERPIRKKKPAIQKIPSDGLEISEGDYIVHKDHGIGIFKGIKRQMYEDIEEDVLVLEYKDGDILYVPTWSVEKIYRYSAKEGFIPPLDKLGSNRWQKAKERERKRIQDIADKLLRLYAQRKTPRGFLYSEDIEVHRNFDEFFPYEETEDQKKAIQEILDRMKQPIPMEVLLCGDAGYGKTEVAMRAAFRAVYDGKQVAVLVPTTLLCEQHYRTFKKRFEAFPINIECINRFRNEKEIKKVIEDTKKGKVDILIGTHMMILKDIDFFDLGLLIIDEEQRFGVIQKERFKEKYPKVDLIMITATPIPRTLQIALSGIWDIFVIQTPPKDRLAVRTFIIPENETIIKEAIQKELQRGGQIFFLHNRIYDIDLVKNKIQRLVPEARIAVVHGRMKEKIVDRIMIDFLDGKIDVLVCTSIIASGLDIPNVNTIIVDQAHMFGLSELYQIRGRVGRSSTQANAYLIIPDESLLTENAKKRIKAIQEMSYLGAGFHIALKDLEIRGAGELLGLQQSGINRVGFDLYIEMLNEAIKEAKGEAYKVVKLPEVTVSATAFIPESYIKETSMRIRIYRKLSQINNLADIDKIYEEIFDRFGKPPEEVENLFKIAQLRVIASKLNIEKIQQKKTGFKFTLQDNVSSEFVKAIVEILSNFKKKEIIKNLKFYPDGFEIEGKTVESLNSLLQKLILKMQEKLETKLVKI